MKDEITVNDDDALDGVEGLSDDALDKLIGDMPKTEDDDEWDAHDVNLEGDDEGEEDDSDDDDGEDKDESEDDLEEDEDDTSSGKSSEGDDEESVDSDESDDDDDSETIDSLSARLELMEAERDAMTAAMERERLLSDRNAGKLGALMQKIEAGQNRKAADGDEFEDDGSLTRRPAKTEIPQERRHSARYALKRLNVQSTMQPRTSTATTWSSLRLWRSTAERTSTRNFRPI